MSAGEALSPLFGRRVHIAGSANKATSDAKRCWAHGFVQNLTQRIMACGGGLVVGAGKEPVPPGCAANAPALVFDWSALEAAAATMSDAGPIWPKWAGPRIVIATSTKAEFEIPENRRDLWSRLTALDDVEVLSILPGARSAAMIRHRQTRFGSAFVALGGGTGVEHLAELYRARSRSVIGLDLQLGASRDDGTGGAPQLAAEARARPEEFVHLPKDATVHAGSMLAAIATRDGAADMGTIAQGTLRLLEAISSPRAFYIRLLNTSHDAFLQVERFFRDVVDVLIKDRGFSRVEVGTDPLEAGFINVEIFERLHHADLVIADVTGDRPNCFIELGYALRGDAPVLLTARVGTRLSFDNDKIPCHFWDPSRSVADEVVALRAFWDKYYRRGPIVRTSQHL
jgi:hypothetical protein